MFKAIMRDNLGWMKDVVIITNSVIELINFLTLYNGQLDDITIDNISKIDDLEQLDINTNDGLKLSVMVK